LSSIYFWTVLIYLLVLAFIGYRASRGVSTQEDFSVAGRRLNTLVLFGTMLATWIGTGSIFGNAEKTYQVGISAFILPLGAIAGIGILYMLAGRARGLREITIQDLLERRYNAAARVCGVIALVLAYTTIVSYQYRAAGAVLNLTLPQVPYEQAVLIVAAFIITYTALAGMVSIAYIGVVQGVTMVAGIILTLPVFYYNAGGINGMMQVLEPSKFEIFGPIGFIEGAGLVLPAFLLVLGDANMYQRFFSAKSSGIAQRAVLWTLGGVTFMELSIIVTAWVASSLEPGLEVPGRVIAFAARDHLPTALGALMLTTIMAIVLSTAGSYLLAPATALVRDIYQRFIRPEASERSLVIHLRILVVLLGVAAYFLSTLSDEFLSVALLAYTIYGASITPALIASFLWRRATAKGAVASIILGTVTTLAWTAWGSPVLDPVIPAVVASVLGLITVSLSTRPTPARQVEPFFSSARGVEE
jgi:Na+/proline symporter